MQTLKQLRVKNNLSQSELADLFGVSMSTIYNMEKDSTNIKDGLLKKYITAFDVSYDEIFLGTEYEISVFEERERNNIVIRLKEMA